MTGEQFYRAHCGAAFDFGMDEPLPWEDLSALEQARWDMLAFEQQLRDRVAHAKLNEEGVPHDGPNAD